MEKANACTVCSRKEKLTQKTDHRSQAEHLHKLMHAKANALKEAAEQGHLDHTLIGLAVS